ncbi:MAG: hypothetical protein U9P49_09885 [Thermodesulfobacteriota bacterium]|nr:hypothetical protein [Thermodesulfobacteriota bacterium]
MVYAMDEATLFDSFFNYLQEIEVFPLLEHLDPQRQRRKNVSFIQMTIVFLMKVVGSIKTIDEMSDLLLTDEISHEHVWFQCLSGKEWQLRKRG